MSVHYMLRYVCSCVLTHCYGCNQQRLEMLVMSLDFIETRESEKGSKTSDMQKLIVTLALGFIRRLVSWTAVMVSIIIPLTHKTKKENGGRNTNLAEYLLIIA